MDSSRPLSLRLKLLLPLVIASLLAIAYIGFVWSPAALEAQKQKYLEDVDRHLDTVVESLVPLMLTSQLDLVHENLGQLRKNNPEWTFILLTDVQGRQLYPPLLGAQAQAALAPSEQALRKNVRFLGRDLGTLVVHVDYASRVEQLATYHRHLAMLLTAIIVVLALTWTAAFELAVVRPLHQLSAAAGELAKRRFDAALPPPGGDEVGRLIASFTAMRDDLKAYQSDLMHEIAEHKRAEEEKTALNATLEQRVHDRTAELEHAFKELEAFSYSVSHDLRAPLRAINGFSRIVLETEGEKLSADGRQMLDRVALNADKLGHLIDDILEYSRSSRVALFASEVNLQALAAKTAADLKDDYPQARVDIGTLPVVTGDPVMLGQVLQNLIGNALKFSSTRDQPRVEIGMEDASGEQVFFVRDNGVGFDMRFAGKLFGMFQRMHAGDTFPGTGVGLAIVKRLIERHSGRVWADAEPDKGATFYFTLGKPVT